ncbi:MAG: tetratricopeptide repeat protein [Gammaproteobacteria bacterium]
MNDYANDEEQLDALKSWWAENGQTVIIAAAVGISLVLGRNFYISSRNDTLDQASDRYYQQFGEDSALSGSPKTSIAEEFPSTPYAVLGNLAEARQAVEDEELDKAAELLQWAADNADQPAVIAQARLRLGSVLLAQQKYDAAMAAVNAIKITSFAASAEELKGDIEAARGNMDKARNAYQGALTQVHKAVPQHAAIIQLKLDSLESR